MARKAVAHLSRILFFYLLTLFAPLILAEFAIYYVHKDHRVAPIAMTSAFQTMVLRARYLPFGDAEYAFTGAVLRFEDWTLHNYFLSLGNLKDNFDVTRFNFS